MLLTIWYQFINTEMLSTGNLSQYPPSSFRAFPLVAGKVWDGSFKMQINVKQERNKEDSKTKENLKLFTTPWSTETKLARAKQAAAIRQSMEAHCRFILQRTGHMIVFKVGNNPWTVALKICADKMQVS